MITGAIAASKTLTTIMASKDSMIVKPDCVVKEELGLVRRFMILADCKVGLDNRQDVHQLQEHRRLLSLGLSPLHRATF
jgi:hypothetical protein